MSATPPFLARTIRRFAVAIILGWLAITVLASIAVPSLEQVGKERSVSMSPKDAPSLQAVMHMGHLFKESDSDSVAMIVLQSNRPLGDEAHKFYDRLVRQLEADEAHVQHVQDFWVIR